MDSSVAHLALCGLLAVSAAADVAYRRIPNVLSLAVGLGGLTASAMNGAVATASALTSGLLVGVLLLVPWKRRLLGGGDVKLAAAAAIGIGLDKLVVFALATALAGGLVSVATCLIAQGVGRRGIQANAVAAVAHRSLAAMASGRSVPYAVAIAAGAAFALWGGTQ